MPSAHELTCERPSCRRKFTAKRSDARYCSRSCRRAKSPESPKQRWTLEERNRHAVLYSIDPALAASEYNKKARRAPPDAPEVPPEVVEEEDLLQGWRRVGPYLVPPFDPRNVFRADDWLR
jgi:hypothetical protein